MKLPIALVGNKSDLDIKRTVMFREAKKYSEENGFIFMETSAKTGKNVDELFFAIGESLLSFCLSVVFLDIDFYKTLILANTFRKTQTAQEQSMDFFRPSRNELDEINKTKKCCKF